MHEEIIKAIARANPYTQKSIQGIFDIVDSYDDTIKVINIARSNGLDLEDIAQAMTVK